MSDWQYPWQQLLKSLYEPVRFFVDPTERLHVLYLATGVICALVVFAIARRRNPDGTPRRFLAYLFPKAIYLHPSAKADYRFFLVDRVLSFLILPFFVILIPAVAVPVYHGLEAVFGAPTAPILAPGLATNIFITLVAALAVDLALWWIHYLHHRIPVLWEFHKVHHSAEVMTPITAYRMHPVEIILNFNLTAAVSGVVFALFQYLTANTGEVYYIVGVDVVTFAFLLFGFSLRHSHVPMAYPHGISHIFVSPWMHQVHHSCEKRHLDKNMGFIFAFWDWMFGTLYIPARGETFAIGLDSGEAPKFHSVTAMYLRPFRKILGLADADGRGASARKSS
jgi:sterol desaturase/sphingolipid hydroxylase (fatty acid hydroxylase superfamily)